MTALSFTLYEGEAAEIQRIIDQLVLETRARTAFLVDRAGQLVATAGEPQVVDTTALGALTAGTVAASNAIAQLLEQGNFPSQYLEGSLNLYTQLIGQRAILVLVFDAKSQLGLVRLRARKAGDRLSPVINRIFATPTNQSGTFLTQKGGVTDEELDNLFAD